MPVRLPGRRTAYGGGVLKPWEKEKIEAWLVEGFTVVEVYAKCIDGGIQPPHNESLYRILNSTTVQQQLKSRKAAEAGSRIAQIAERTRSRQKLLAKIEATVEARADEYAELIPGGDQGLVVLSDRKVIRTGEHAYDTYDIYKTDTGMMEQWRGVLTDQDKSDAALLKNLRGEEREQQEAEQREQVGVIRDLERQKLELEIVRLRAEVEALEAERKRAGERGYAAPSFPEVIVEALPAVVRPAHLDPPDTEEDEATTPEIPWILEESAESASHTGTTEALE